MTVRDVLDAMDYMVWVRVRPCTPGHPDDDIVVWSSDWLSGVEGDPGIPDGLARYLDCTADDLCIEAHEDPERGDEAPMLVVCAYNSTSEEKKEEREGVAADDTVNILDLAREVDRKARETADKLAKFSVRLDEANKTRPRTEVKMADADTRLVTGTRAELMAQNKKLDKIAEQLEVQTRLQEGILRQLYLLCQMTATPSDHLRAKMANSSVEVMRAVRMGEHTVLMEEQP